MLGLTTRAMMLAVAFWPASCLSTADLPARPALGRAERQPDLSGFAVAQCVEVNRRAGCHHGNDLREITRTHERRAVDGGEHVTFFNVRVVGGATPVKAAQELRAKVHQ